jgi:hypothetical protein
MLILSNLMLLAIHSSETSDLIRATKNQIPEDDILHSHRRENLKSYSFISGLKVEVMVDFATSSSESYCSDSN